MAKVCKNRKIVNNYLDQVDERNSSEKDRYKQIINDYAKLQNINQDLILQLR